MAELERIKLNPEHQLLLVSEMSYTCDKGPLIYERAYLIVSGRSPHCICSLIVSKLRVS